MLSPSRMTDAKLEVLLFRAGGVRFGVALAQVVGMVRGLPHHGDPIEDAETFLFEGRDVPVFPAGDFLHEIGPTHQTAEEAIIFDDGLGYFGMAVEATESVVDVTPGDGLYVLPPQEATDLCPCRPWGVLTVSERPVILLDMSRVAVH